MTSGFKKISDMQRGMLAWRANVTAAKKKYCQRLTGNPDASHSIIPPSIL
jgi:hypothetical protein